MRPGSERNRDLSTIIPSGIIAYLLQDTRVSVGSHFVNIPWSWSYCSSTFRASPAISSASFSNRSEMAGSSERRSFDGGCGEVVESFLISGIVHLSLDYKQLIALQRLFRGKAASSPPGIFPNKRRRPDGPGLMPRYQPVLHRLCPSFRVSWSRLRSPTGDWPDPSRLSLLDPQKTQSWFSCRRDIVLPALG